MTTETIRQRINKTKSREEWQAEINYLADYFAHRCISFQMHIPDNWKGVTLVKTESFVLIEKGKPIHCQGMWKEKDDWYNVCLESKEKTSPTLHLLKIKNMASYQTIVKTLLKAIDGLVAYENWLTED